MVSSYSKEMWFIGATDKLFHTVLLCLLISYGLIENRCHSWQSHIPLRLYSLLFLLTHCDSARSHVFFWLCLLLFLPICVILAISKRKGFVSVIVLPLNHVFYLEDDWLIMSFHFEVVSCSCTYLTRSILVRCSLSSLSPHHVLSSLSYHDVLQELHPPLPSWHDCQLFHLPLCLAASISWHRLILGPRLLFHLWPSLPSLWDLLLSPRWALAHLCFVGGPFQWVITSLLIILVTDGFLFALPMTQVLLPQFPPFRRFLVGSGAQSFLTVPAGHQNGTRN